MSLLSIMMDAWLPGKGRAQALGNNPRSPHGDCERLGLFPLANMNPGQVMLVTRLFNNGSGPSFSLVIIRKAQIHY